MVLDGLEKEINQQACLTQYRNGRWYNPLKVHFVRYADAFVVTCANREYLEEIIHPLIGKFLAERGLELSPEKTKITHINDGFDFLGFNVRKYNGKCLTKPKKDSIESIYSTIRQCVTSHKMVTQKMLIQLIKPKIRGWANFFRHAASKRTFALLDDKMFKLLWKWAKRRHPNKSLHWVKAHYFKKVGNRNWVFMTSDNKPLTELPRFDATKIIRHNKIKSHSNPYDKNWNGYFEERARKRLDKNKNISKLTIAL